MKTHIFSGNAEYIFFYFDFMYYLKNVFVIFSLELAVNHIKKFYRFFKVHKLGHLKCTKG